MQQRDASSLKLKRVQFLDAASVSGETSSGCQLKFVFFGEKFPLCVSTVFLLSCSLVMTNSDVAEFSQHVFQHRTRAEDFVSNHLHGIAIRIRKAGVHLKAKTFFSHQHLFQYTCGPVGIVLRQT